MMDSHLAQQLMVEGVVMEEVGSKLGLRVWNGGGGAECEGQPLVDV